MESVIKINDVHKKFKVYFDKGNSLKEKILFKNRNYYEDRWILRGINFEVKKGEAIGLIGENGSGKSTLLKLMTRIMYPDKGKIELCGRVSSLIELGAGFHPDMSGRENIYTNASIFGLNHKEIQMRIDKIIAFSELGEYIDNPVRTYSSGMYMRLAFAVAINVDAEILLIDEILAVGDAAFQAKCFNKMREIKAQGTTIVLVSHSLGQVEQICDRSLWIKDGKIYMEGTPREVHSYYLEFMGDKNEERKQITYDKIVQKENILSILDDDIQHKNSKQETINRNRFGNKEIEFTYVEMRNILNEEKNKFYTDEVITIYFEYKSNKNNVNSNIGIAIYRNDGVHCYGTNTLIEKHKLISIKNSGNGEAKIKCNNLMPGEYILDIAAYTEDNFPQDDFKCAKTFFVISRKSDVGLCKLDIEWAFNGELL